jgi:hypothetical protein
MNVSTDKKQRLLKIVGGRWGEKVAKEQASENGI